MAENKASTAGQVILGVVVTLIVLAGLSVLIIWLVNPEALKRNNFPTNPIVGQRFAKDGVTYEWNGTAWVIVGQPDPTPDVVNPNVVVVPVATRTYIIRNQPPNTICFNKNDMEECVDNISYSGCNYELISSNENFCCYKKTSC